MKSSTCRAAPARPYSSHVKKHDTRLLIGCIAFLTCGKSDTRHFIGLHRFANENLLCGFSVCKSQYVYYKTPYIYYAYSSLFMHLSMSNPRGGGWATHGNLTVAYIPRVGILIGHHAFDLSILYSRREVNHLFLLILTILPRGGDFDNFF